MSFQEKIFMLKGFKCFIVISMITFVGLGLSILPNAPAQTTGFNYSDYNYTNIFTNKTAADLFESMRGHTIPARDLDFGISISKTCYNIHRFNPINSTSSCPTYEAIMLLFPDTSDQEVSGAFIYKHNQLQRGRPQMENNYNYYAFMENKTMLFIDPDSETKKQLGMITIYSQLPLYPINYKVIDNTRIMGEGRYIDNCRNAVIDARNWVFLLGDTIEYLRHDCHPTFTFFNSTKIFYENITKHDITTSNKWLHDQFIEWVKENCLYEYDVC